MGSVRETSKNISRDETPKKKHSVKGFYRDFCSDIYSVVLRPSLSVTQKLIHFLFLFPTDLLPVINCQILFFFFSLSCSVTCLVCLLNLETSMSLRFSCPFETTERKDIIFETGSLIRFLSLPFCLQCVLSLWLQKHARYNRNMGGKSFRCGMYNEIHRRRWA
jgi:hypothetical protein